MDEKLRNDAIFYEIRALEYLDSLYLERDIEEQKKVKEYALKLFEVVSQDDLRDYKSELELMNTILLYSSVAYCAGAFDQLSNWYNRNDKIIKLSGRRSKKLVKILLRKLYECWLILFTNEDANKVLEIVKELRDNQHEIEQLILKAAEEYERRRNAYFLIACYHLARVVEIIAQYKTGIHTDNTINSINYHFQYISECLSHAVFIIQNYCIGWLHAAAIEMIKNQKGGR
jgi:hypothetical protein